METGFAGTFSINQSFCTEKWSLKGHIFTGQESRKKKCSCTKFCFELSSSHRWWSHADNDERSQVDIHSFKVVWSRQLKVSWTCNKCVCWGCTIYVLDQRTIDLIMGNLYYQPILKHSQKRETCPHRCGRFFYSFKEGSTTNVKDIILYRKNIKSFIFALYMELNSISW